MCVFLHKMIFERRFQYAETHAEAIKLQVSWRVTADFDAVR